MRTIVVSWLSILGLGWGAAQAQQTQELPQPGPEHQRLGYFAGQWRFEGEMKEGPMGPGGQVTMSDRCEWFDGGFALVCHTEGQTPMGPAKGMGIMTYSPAKRAYTYYGIDSMGFSDYATGQVEGDTWTYSSESEMEGKPIRTRVTIQEASPTAYRFKFELSVDGGPWVTTVEGTETKM